MQDCCAWKPYLALPIKKRDDREFRCSCRCFGGGEQAKRGNETRLQRRKRIGTWRSLVRQIYCHALYYHKPKLCIMSERTFCSNIARPQSELHLVLRASFISTLQLFFNHPSGSCNQSVHKQITGDDQPDNSTSATWELVGG